MCHFGLPFPLPPPSHLPHLLTPPLASQIALKLLDCDFPDESVRGFATSVLDALPDERLEDVLLQLTQVSKDTQTHSG